MVKAFKLTPAVFLVSESLILTPSLLLLIGIFLSLFQSNNMLYSIVSGNSLLRNIFIGILMPFAGGFLSYQYLERYALSGIMRKTTKIILGYSILEIGIFSMLLFLH